MTHMTNPPDILCPFCRTPNRITAKYCTKCGNDVTLNNDIPSDDRRYFITRVIKAGGQGSVYEGIDQQGNVYAIKEMIDNFTDQDERDEGVTRFNAEANLLQSLHHPRIPRVYSHFTDESRHYLTMDLIQGKDVEDIIEHQGAIPEAQVLAWADQICDVLGYLHDQGLIYRDVKPSNVMIEPDGNVKLIDFGIAKVFTPNQRGTLIGTPGYAPPEQYQGMATAASDIYALGATLHHMLTGRDPTQHTPFSFEPVRTLKPNISERTDQALQKALSMQPQDRFATVAEFRAMLHPSAGPSKRLPASTPNASTIAVPANTPPPIPRRVTPPDPPAARPVSPPVRNAPPARNAPPPARSPIRGGKPHQSKHPAKPYRGPQPRSGQVPMPKPIAFIKGRCGTCMLWSAAGVLILFMLGVAAFFFLLTTARSDAPATATPTVQTTPTTLPLPTGMVSLQVEAVVAAGASDDEITQAFFAACEQAAQETYGSDVRINRNFTGFADPDQYWTQVGVEKSGALRYRATMQTLLYRE